MCDIFCPYEQISLLQSSFAEDIYCIFFLHQCPPCRAFTPKVGENLKKLKEKGVNVEFIFVSSDRSKESFEEYFATMPFLAIPYEDQETRNNLSKHFEVEGEITCISFCKL